MLTAPRIPEIGHRDRFIKKAVAQRLVFAVAGEDGLARVPSQRQRGRETTLVWTTRSAAARWADAISSNPRIKEITLDALIGEVLPALSRLKRGIGPDWGAAGIEPELDPLDVAQRLTREIVDGFVERTTASRKVFVLEDSSGPALLVSQARPDRLVLPAWSERASAEQRIEGPWADMLAVELPLASFTATTLGWLDGRGWLVAPDHVLGPGASELAPCALRARLKA
mgnify:CR=1 FL=1